MLNFNGNRRIFLARSPIDMRKGAGTLATIVEHSLGMDPYAGDIFVFLGKHANRVRVLVWDRSGFWLASKRLWTFALLLTPHAALARASSIALIFSSLTGPGPDSV